MSVYVWWGVGVVVVLLALFFLIRKMADRFDNAGQD